MLFLNTQALRALFESHAIATISSTEFLRIQTTRQSTWPVGVLGAQISHSP